MDISKSLEGSILDTNKISNSFASVKDNISDTTVKATESVKQFVQNNTSDKTLIFGLIGVVLLAALVSYGLYYLVTRNIFKNIKQVVPETKIPVFANELVKVPITVEPAGNGQRRSYSFWIYINDMNKYSGLYKHVLHIGDSKDIVNASPYIFLDKEKNRLYVRFSSTNPTNTVNVSGSIGNISADNLASFMQQGTIIPYIPLQRWVHVAIVVNQNTSGGSVTTYVDGDLASINNHGTSGEGDLGAILNGKTLDYTNLNLDKSGTLVIGGNPYDNTGNGFSGLISKVTTYNYDLNQKDIYKDYNEGPIDSILAKLGLGMYGVRSPVYKL